MTEEGANLPQKTKTTRLRRLLALDNGCIYRPCSARILSIRTSTSQRQKDKTTSQKTRVYFDRKTSCTQPQGRSTPSTKEAGLAWKSHLSTSNSADCPDLRSRPSHEGTRAHPAPRSTPTADGSSDPRRGSSGTRRRGRVDVSEPEIERLIFGRRVRVFGFVVIRHGSGRRVADISATVGPVLAGGRDDRRARAQSDV